MQHQNKQHQSRQSQQQRAQVRRNIDGFSAGTRRPQPQYQRRANGIIPSTEQEYMIALGGRASRRDMHASPAKKASKATAAKKKLQKLYASRHQLQQTHKRKLLPTLAVVAALSFGLFGMLHTGADNSVIADPDLRKILEDNGDTPTDKLAYNQGNYQVAPDLPRMLDIKKLGIQSRVTRLTTRDNSEPKSPQNIYDIGWYENSAKPGENGATLLIGHKNGSEKIGVFHDLTKLVPGDEFQLELGDGTIKNYQVVKLDTFPRGQVDYRDLVNSAVEGVNGLNLLTAVGSFTSNAGVTQQLAVYTIEKMDDQSSQATKNTFR